MTDRLEISGYKATGCHTRGSLSFYCTHSPADATSTTTNDDTSADKVVFTGDTLFLGTCMRRREEGGRRANQAH